MLNADLALAAGTVTFLCLALSGLCQLQTRMFGRALEPLKAKRLMTHTEIGFYRQLRRAMPGYEVLPQVAMAALLDVNVRPNSELYWNLRKKFGTKVCDFVVCSTRSMKVIAVVELDDRTHDLKAAADESRDHYLRLAGVRTVRFDCRTKQSDAQLARAILARATDKASTI